jgi:hypothetical protein
MTSGVSLRLGLDGKDYHVSFAFDLQSTGARSTMTVRIPYALLDLGHHCMRIAASTFREKSRL